MIKSPVAITFLATAASLDASQPMPPPPIMAITDAAGAGEAARAAIAERRRTVTFDIAVRGAGQPIWSGSLRTAAGGVSGEYSQSKREPLDPCPGETSNRYPGRQDELRVSFSRSYGSEDNDRFTLSVNWIRPAGGCAEGFGGSRTVAIQQSFAVAPGETRKLTGDGGLEVTVTRRR